jgi:DNA-binding transcriptional LysR family regulator
MTNIPTDLLRTFVSVVDLRSFTRAAKAQGMTQPAVSAQIRRLQGLLGVELFDKSAPGVSLTPMGEQVMGSARRLLSVNDHIVQISRPPAAAQLVRVGVPGDYIGTELANMLAASRARWPDVRFAVKYGGPRRLLNDLKHDEADIVLARVIDEPDDSARHYWREELAWVRAKSLTLDPKAPVPMVAYTEDCLGYRVAAAALDKVGRAAELVFRGTTAGALYGAVAAGLGVMVVPPRRVPPELSVWDDGPLPPLPQVYCGVFVREVARSETLDELADHIAQTLRPPAIAPDRLAGRSRGVKAFAIARQTGVLDKPGRGAY